MLAGYEARYAELKFTFLGRESKKYTLDKKKNSQLSFSILRSS